MKKIFTLSIALLTGWITFFAAEKDAVPSNQCGENLTWEITADGTLVILGSGDMYEWKDRNGAPWYAQRDDIMRVSMSDGVTSVGQYAFFECSNLSSVSIPTSVTSMGNSAFEGCSRLSNVSLPPYLSSLGASVFFNCPSLAEISLPEGVKEIPDAGFAYSGIAHIDLPQGVTRIGYAAFLGCSRLTDIVLPDSVSSIDDMAFMVSVTVSQGYLPYVPTPFTRIDVAPGNPYFTSIDGVLFDKEGKTLIAYPEGKSDKYVVPNGVEQIGAYAFIANITLKDLVLPSSLQAIGVSAFSSFPATSITCEALTPPALLADDAWSSIGLGDAVDAEGKHVPVTLYVPASSVEAYKNDKEWSKADTILPIAAAVVEVVEVQAEPTDNSVVIEWPTVEDATEYTIVITKNGEIVCTLTFNGNGELINIAYAMPARDGRSRGVPKATKTNTGWQFMINGLEPGTQYEYTIVAKKDDAVLFEETKDFTTQEAPTGVESIQPGQTCVSYQKILRNGQVIILRGDKVYTLQGQEVK